MISLPRSLPRFFRLPRLSLPIWRRREGLLLGGLPEQIVALDAEERERSFRLRAGWDGHLSIIPQTDMAIDSRRPLILCLHPSLGFHRLGRVEPRSRQDLLRLCDTLFPFEPDSVAYAFSHDQDQRLTYHAFPQSEIERLRLLWPGATVILPCAPSGEAIMPSLRNVLRGNSAADLMPLATRLRSPASMRSLLFSLAAIGALILAMMAWSEKSDSDDRALRTTLHALETQAAPIQKQRQTILKMAAALRHHQEFSQQSTASALGLMAEIFTRVPNGAAIERAEFRQGNLTIQGLGNNPAPWLTAPGHPEPDLTLEPLGKLTRFTATYKITAPETAKPPVKGTP